MGSTTARPRLSVAFSTRAMSAATVAIVGLTTIQVVDTPLTTLPTASAATRTVFGTSVPYDDQIPASVPWSTTVKQNVTRYGNLYLSLDAVAADGIAKTGTYDQWGSPVPLTIWDSTNQTKYRNGFTSAVRPDPFSNSNRITSELGDWTYVSQSSSFTVTWNPAPGYIGYAPPLPIQIDPSKPGGQPSPQYDYATTGLPGKTTTPLKSTGALGTTQTTQAGTGFQGVTDGIIWDGYTATYAFQIDRNDSIAKLAGLTDGQFTNDDNGNYVGYVTNELTTSEGTYTINPDSGEIKFTPNNDFFKAGDPTTKAATPIRVIVSNMTTNTDEGNGRVMAYGLSRPAHTINPNNQSYSEVTTTYTPTVTKPSVQLVDVFAHNQVGKPVTLRPNYAQKDGQPAINMATVELIGADGTNAGKTLTVQNEGIWQVNNDGTVTFTPEVGFIGNPTPVTYTAKNSVGIPADPATLSVEYFVPDGRPATTYGTQGMPQKSTDQTTSQGNRGLTAQQMFPGYPSNWYSSFEYELVDPNGKVVDPNTALKIPNVGAYTIDPASGEVTFTPDPLFKGAAPEVKVRIANLKTANGQVRGEDGSYVPVVTSSNVQTETTTQTTTEQAAPVTVTQTTEVPTTVTTQVPTTVEVPTTVNGTPTTVTTTQSVPTTVTAVVPTTVTTTQSAPPVLADAEKVSTQPGAVTVTPHYASNVDKSTLKFVNGDQLVDELKVEGQGTWKVDKKTGEFTFTPVDGFTDDPASVQYTATTKDGVEAEEPATLTVSYQLPAAPVTVTQTTEVPTTVTTQVPTTVEVPTTVNGTPTTVTETQVVPTTVTTQVPTTVTTTQAPEFNLPNVVKVATKAGPVEFAPNYPKNVDKSSVRFLDGDGNEVNVLVATGEGTWKVDENGTMSFIPAEGFTGDPTPVKYTASNSDGVKATEPAEVSVKYQLPATETATATVTEKQTETTEKTADPVTVTTEATREVEVTKTVEVPTTVNGTPTTVTETRIETSTVTETATETHTETTEKTADPVTTTVTKKAEPVTITQIPAPVTVTATAEPVTVTPDPQTTVVTVTAEPTPVTVTAEPVTVTPDPVTTTVNGTPVTIENPPVTVTPDPITVTVTPDVQPVTVTITPEAATVTPDPVTVTATPAPVTTVVKDVEVRVEASTIQVWAKKDVPFTVQVRDKNVEPGTLKFTNGQTELEVDEGTYLVDSQTGKVTFTPKPGFTGTVTPVELTYTRTDGAIVETPVRIEAFYNDCGCATPKPEESDPANSSDPSEPNGTSAPAKPSGSSQPAQPESSTSETDKSTTPDTVEPNPNESSSAPESPKPTGGVTKPSDSNEPSGAGTPGEPSKPTTSPETSEPTKPAKPVETTLVTTVNGTPTTVVTTVKESDTSTDASSKPSDAGKPSEPAKPVETTLVTTVNGTPTTVVTTVEKPNGDSGSQEQPGSTVTTTSRKPWFPIPLPLPLPFPLPGTPSTTTTANADGGVGGNNNHTDGQTQDSGKKSEEAKDNSGMGNVLGTRPAEPKSGGQNESKANDTSVAGGEDAGSDSGSSGSGSSSTSGGLASTGANVLGVLGLGVAMILAGAFISRRKRGNEA